jgi:hypothetical protein
MAQALALLWLVGAVAGCPAATPVARPPGDGAAACDGASLEACERSMVGAGADQLDALLGKYVAAGGDARWRSIHQALRDGSAVALLSRGAAPEVPAAVERIALPDRPPAIGDAAMLLALGRHGKRRHLLLSAGGVSRQLFPGDALAPFALRLPAVLSLDPSQVAADTAIARQVDRALRAASSFDYVVAARAVDELDKALQGQAPRAAVARAHYARSLLRRAAIALEAEGDDPARAAEGAPPSAAKQWPTPQTPYGAWLVAKLAGDGRPQVWKQHRTKLVAGLDPARVALLDAMMAGDDACPEPPAPPMDHVGDLGFTATLAGALDTEANAGAEPAAGKLALGEWLARYDAAVQMADRQGVGWSLLPSLLYQRGELHGLSAEGSASYERVTKLGLRHLRALGTLVEAEPGRFRALAVVLLVYQPGLLRDPRLRDAVVGLLDKSLELGLGAAADAGQIFDASLAAVMAGMTFPPELQGAQLGALDRALSRKLESSSMRDQRGWGVAGLQAVSGALGLLMGDKGRPARVAPRVAAALRADGAPLAQAPLAKLAVSAAGYVTLAHQGKLDAKYANANLFPPERRKALAALENALAGLSDGGPARGPERELLEDLAVFADGMVAALFGQLRAPAAEGPSCSGSRRVKSGTPLRDAYDRLRKTRKRLLSASAFTEGKSSWRSRVRLVVLLLSDVLDLADRRHGTMRFAVDGATAQKIVDDAFADWGRSDYAKVGLGGYLVARALGSDDKADSARLGSNLSRGLQGLAALFRDESGRQRSVFDALAKASAEGSGPVGGDLSALLVKYAGKAYQAGTLEQGDLFLFAALGAAVVKEQPVAQRARTLARKYQRPVELPLLLSAYRYGSSDDPVPLFAAMRSETKQACRAPSPEGVIRLRQAEVDFRKGKRRMARHGLDQLLADARREGLPVPRMSFVYQEATAEKVFKLEGSFSFASGYLKGAGSLQVGLGLRTEGQPDTSLDVRFPPAQTARGDEESARLYAYAAGLAALYAYVDGDAPGGAQRARMAVDSWVNGVRLGARAVPSGPRTADWAADASAILALDAQLAAEAGHALLAGDLFTLARASLGADADDAAVAEVLDPLPHSLRGIAELRPLAQRAKKSLQLVASKLACTKKPVDPKPLTRVGCARYPLAVALRAAEGLPALPRLKRAAQVGRRACGSWRALDRFFVAADKGRYEPDRLLEAIAALRNDGRDDDAAMLLARQRHPRHCTPPVLKNARALSQKKLLGVHLRSDMLSVVANCAGATPDAVLVDDLVALDQLTQQHALPMRNYELLVFAARLAIGTGDYQPLHRISQAPGFVARWQRLGPDLGTTALLLHHAAAVGAGKPLDSEGTAPFYRLLCTTFPQKHRRPMCGAMSMLRGAAGNAEKKRVATDALRAIVQQATGRPSGEKR